ncbi:hypothetical protein ACH9EU_04345 [Kocuria sp. M1R5S2]|uniref:hypothetical protein n=1 Tax=Kocuria rhizosphaerae TaxID=3376285 RepID=UPI0037BCBD47
MSSTPDDHHPSKAADENTVEPSAAAGDASDGLANPEAAEQFQQAVEHRLIDQAREKSDTDEEEAPETEPEEDSPVRMDNPE